MCLIVEKSKKVKVAKENIICYKLLKKDLRSSIQNFQYELGREYETSLSKVDCGNLSSHWNWCDQDSADAYQDIMELCYAYQQGFHSYKTKKRAGWECSYYYISSFLLYKCTIPKGSEYIEDATGLICSNRIIIVNRIRWNKL